MSIAVNIQTVRRRIEAAVRRRAERGLKTTPVKLVAVTKNQDEAAIRQCLDAGIDAIGENRVQEAQAKYPQFSSAVEWHLIGHLQTNKVKYAVRMFDYIHSVDSARLAQEIDKIAGKIGKQQPVLIQVNAAAEETKFGIEPDETLRLAEFICSLTNVKLCGLMTIAPYFANPENARPVFQEMYALFTRIRDCEFPEAKIEWLSMGMTNDYEIAVEEGANLVRVGTAIFGPRQY
ncbi:MAG: YggS family pyridoxal phosphate-dependent enzyme [Negativicutes bacterium]|nr:YggS family pyridoxal phosphate-dependent enzyme [Negativicutes bacterium]